MSLSINTNLASLNAQRKLTGTTNVLSTTFQRLSSGLRINSAKDDAAGLTIATRMTAQIRGINQAMRNANDGISMMQVAEGALDETSNALQRIRELSVQAANDTLVGADRLAIQDEINQLLNEIDRIAVHTEFNNQVLLSGGWETAKVFQVGAEAGQMISMTVDRTTTTSLLSMTAVGAAGAINVSTQASANATIARIDRALDSVSDIRANLGAFQNRFEAVIANLGNVSENTSASRSRIMDADIAAESANLTRNSILQQAGTAILAQANQQPSIALQLLK
ncbi:Flagellin [Candidatus Magnetaquicoccaceae bacterium FCR-1]|uniref:Flagellin n=1 Tax=Candidatus Magnetaquiglobus chichijimensis TaxID=3141448 RepID=A0ABQ0CD58_9PROT